MKKAAERKVVRAPKVKGKNYLLLLALFVIAVVGFVVWAVIAKSPAKTPNAAVALCSVDQSVINPGSSFTIYASGFGPGPLPIRMVGVYGTPTADLAILNKDPFVGQSVPIAQNQQLGNYRVYVDAGGYGKVFCTPDHVNVVSPSTPACSFLESSTYAGNKISVYVTGGLTGEIRIIRTDASSISQSILIGNAPGTNATYITNNIYAPAGNYFLQVGTSRIYCKNSSGNDILNVISPIITCRGADLDNNGKVGLGDVTQVALRWNSVIGDGKYNPQYDVNKDGKIGLADTTAISLHWNEFCT